MNDRLTNSLASLIVIGLISGSIAIGVRFGVEWFFATIAIGCFVLVAATIYISRG